MLIRRMFTYAALAIVALAGLGVIWVGNLLPLKAGLAAPGTPKARVLIASSPPRILFQSHAGNPADTEVEYQRYMKTQMELHEEPVRHERGAPAAMAFQDCLCSSLRPTRSTGSSRTWR